MTRTEAGKKAKNNGQVFEDIFQAACDQVGIACTPFPLGCKRAGLKRLIQVKTPWDFILSYKSRSAMIDTKSHNSSRFPASKIEPHQVDEMAKHEACGTVAGYVVWLRKIGTVVFISGAALRVKRLSGGSLRVGDPGVTELGSLKMFGTEVSGELRLNRIWGNR